ncbi:hypothetical protein [Methylobacterium mesophilicum]|uniref:hypothetical protein n=1 Tax=Methylobacterium mesophilicum TaxID=39956 RepID=UPI002F2E7EFE
MELGYLRRLDLRTAGRVSFGEWARPADRCDEEREALERATNALDELAREQRLSGDIRQELKAIVLELMRLE